MLPRAFFWVNPVKEAAWDPFWWIILFGLILWIPFLRVWWWVFLPIMLLAQLKELYIWWISWDYDYAKWKWIMLEVITPKEILTPIKAMEDFFSMMWPIWDHPNFREKWCDGELDNGPFWFSAEIASIEGKVHFYFRVMSAHRTALETALYAHYPDFELRPVSDYTKLVPPTVPNEEWDMYGEDFDTKKPAAYPLRTYEKFFEPQGERISAEEKRIDPISSLLEALSRLGPGEHYWVQFICVPVKEDDEPEWKEEAKKIVNKISKRPEKVEIGFFEEIVSMISMVFMGPKQEGSGDKAKYSWIDASKTESGEKELLLTPGEREIVTEIEKKLSKSVFRTHIRGVYIAKRESWVSSHKTLLRSYMAHFNTNNMNLIIFNATTRPKIHYFMRKRRAFLRTRRIFKNSIERFAPLFPDRRSIMSILSTEELTTLFHFPIKLTGMVTPTLGKVESKKAGPPPNLPIE